MTETFLAKVISIDEETKIVTIQPLIVNVDGQDHVELSAKTLNGQEVTVDDILIVQTSKNDLDGEPISDYEIESRTNCIITGVFTAKNGYKLKGDYTFTGDVKIDGNLTIGNEETPGELKIVGDLIINGQNFDIHTHDPGSYIDAELRPITGISGTVSP